VGVIGNRWGFSSGMPIGTILYSRGGAGAFEYTCEASAGQLRLKARWLFSSYSPELVGSEFTVEVEQNGNEARSLPTKSHIHGRLEQESGAGTARLGRPA
jgi:hypothetical protein